MVVGDQCGFPSNYYPAHAPLGFPQCFNYKGTQSQRIADLKRRGSGTYQIAEWNKWYEDQATAVRVDAVIRQRMAVVDSERAAEAAIQLQREKTIYDAGVAEAQRLQKVAENKRLQEIKDQEITFNEQTNSGDFNETPITDVNLDGGCSGCGVDLQNIIKETQNKENYMKFAGIAAAGVIGLLLYSKGGLK